MPDWNTLFLEQRHREPVPEAEVYRVVHLLEEHFTDRPLRLWDLGCGAGRHTVALAKFGYDIFASDTATNGVQATRDLLLELNLQATLEEADMSHCPWPDKRFHGIFSWDVLQHSTLNNIENAVDMIFDHLVPGGLLLATIKSDKADLFGQGREIEPKTFVKDSGSEAGVPHHYFNMEELQDLFSRRPWETLAMTEQVITNVIRPDRFWEYTPFRSTTWGVLMRRPS